MRLGDAAVIFDLHESATRPAKQEAGFGGGSLAESMVTGFILKLCFVFVAVRTRSALSSPLAEIASSVGLFCCRLPAYQDLHRS